jgi:hypothetical protein
MYARLSTLDDVDLERLREVAGAFAAPGTRRLLLLHDENARVASLLALFDTREELAEAESAFGEVDDPGGRRSRLQTYEVVLDDYADGASFVIVTPIEATRQDLGHALSLLRDDLLARVRAEAAGAGALVLANHGQHDDVLFLTFWTAKAEGASYQDVIVNRRL